MLYPDCQTYAEAARTGPSYIIPQIQQFSRFCHTFFIKPLLVSSSLLLFCQSKNLRLHAISPLFLLQETSLKIMEIAYIITMLLSDPKLTVTPWEHPVPSA